MANNPLPQPTTTDNGPTQLLDVRLHENYMTSEVRHVLVAQMLTSFTNVVGTMIHDYKRQNIEGHICGTLCL